MRVCRIAWWEPEQSRTRWPSGIAAGGFVGRASGRITDARIKPGYPPYHMLEVASPIEADGDVAARIRVRIAELIESTRLIRRLLAQLPGDQIAVAPPSGSGMGWSVA